MIAGKQPSCFKPWCGVEKLCVDCATARPVERPHPMGEGGSESAIDGYWRSATGENHGRNSKPGDVWVSFRGQYDETYYERGVEARVSGYTNYHWRPDYVLPLANLIKEMFGVGPTLDFGCAKGYLVKALRLLGVEAYGYDISEYAIANADPMIKHAVANQMRWSGKFQTVIAKDVLEHVPLEKIDAVLKELEVASLPGGSLMVVVPLGDHNLYRIREYELDATHQIRADEVWWIHRLVAAGFFMESFHYALPGVKEQWTKTHQFGNGIFICKKPGTRPEPALGNL